MSKERSDHPWGCSDRVCVCSRIRSNTLTIGSSAPAGLNCEVDRREGIQIGGTSPAAADDDVRSSPSRSVPAHSRSRSAGAVQRMAC